jgi:hypothetical protein
MLLGFLVSLRLRLSVENHPEMMKLAQSIPVFGLLYSPVCLPCPELWRTWDNFSAEYADDPQILLVSINCSQDNITCAKVMHVTSFPTFFQIFGDALETVRVERSLEAFRARADLLKQVEPGLKCRPFVNQTGVYPLFGISLPENQSAACDQLLAIQDKIPEVRNRLFLAYPRTRMYIKLTIFVSQYFFSEQWINNRAVLLEDYVRDYLVPTLGNWSFNVSRQITQRRFGFLIYTNAVHIGQTSHFALFQIERFCFGLMHLDEFHRKFPKFELAESELPAIAIVNKERTKFRVIRDLIFDDYLERMFASLVLGLPDPEMIHPYTDKESGSIEGVFKAKYWCAALSAGAFALVLGIVLCRCHCTWGKIGKWFQVRSGRLGIRHCLWTKGENRSAAEVPLIF